MDKNAVPHAVVLEFLGSRFPFNALAQSDLQRFAQRAAIDFFPKGTLIFRQGETEVTHFYVIQKGGVRSYRVDAFGNLTLKDFRGEGEHFGALPIIQNTRANLNVETLDDTFCFLFDKKDFLTLLKTNHKVKQHYLRTMSEKMVQPVYAQLRQQKILPRAEGALFLFSARVGEISKERLFTAPERISVQEASLLMSEKRIGSILLTNDQEEIVGIVTDKDIRGKVVAKGLDYRTQASEIMAAPVQTISGQAVCFDALLSMIKNCIHHLAVEENGKIVKMLTTHDIMVAQGSSPYFLFREIQAQRQVSGLYELSRKIPMIVRPLIEEGAKACHVTRMVSVLNDHVLDRLLTLVQEEIGPPPLPFSWLLTGSEGRQEQIFKSAQANAVIYEDGGDDDACRKAEDYFRMLSEQAVKHLMACGYSSGHGENTATDSKWRQPQSVWESYFQDWRRFPDRERNFDPALFFDFRSGAGNAGLEEALREKLHALTRGEQPFLRFLVRPCISIQPPLSFYGNFVVEKDGKYSNALDVEGKTLFFFVVFARAMALKYGIGKTNTIERLRLLLEQQRIHKDLCSELIEAYELLMHLRLVHQLRLIEDEQAPNNLVCPGDLSDLEKQTLKETFEVIRRLQEFARHEFGLLNNP